MCAELDKSHSTQVTNFELYWATLSVKHSTVRYTYFWVSVGLIMSVSPLYLDLVKPTSITSWLVEKCRNIQPRYREDCAKFGWGAGRVTTTSTHEWKQEILSVSQPRISLVIGGFVDQQSCLIASAHVLLVTRLSVL